MDATGDIKERLSVDEVVGGYVQLKNAGRNFKGLCPFHQEKTPSFIVSPDKGIYHCFGCGEGGDIFTFVEKMDGLDFRGALEKLATQAGVELPERGASEGAKQHKQRLYEALASAAQYYHIQLSRDETAKEYAQTTRSFTPDTIKRFKLGFAPAGGQRLSEFLHKKDFSDKELIDAGLARKGRGGLQDMFRSRLMVPFFDNQGRVIGFTGRHLGDGQPKYLNTPQTKLFDKSRFVFGLYQAKEAIRTSGAAVVAEGNLDVLTSAQAGVANVVAISGTAMTLPQLKQLGRLADRVVLAFDADSAGVKAAERAIPIAQEAGIELAITTLPDGADPDELIRQDSNAWQRTIETAQVALDWLIAQLQDQYDITTPQGKGRFTSRLAGVVAAVTDPVVREHYITVIADIAHVAPAAVTAKLDQSRPTRQRPQSRRAKVETTPVAKTEFGTVTGALLAVTATYPDTRPALQDIGGIPGLEPTAVTLLEWLQHHEDADLGSDSLPDELQPHANYVKILLLRGEEEYGPWAPLDRQVEAFSLAHRLLKLDIRQRQQQLSADIAAAERAGDSERKQNLLKQYNDLLK